MFDDLFISFGILSKQNLDTSAIYSILYKDSNVYFDSINTKTDLKSDFLITVQLMENCPEFSDEIEDNANPQYDLILIITF